MKLLTKLPRQFARMLFLTLALGALLMLTCRADDPGGTSSRDRSVQQKDAGGSVSCANVAKLDAPVLDVMPSITGNAVQAFHGAAPGAAMITARLGTTAGKPVQVSGDGRFCIEVQLIPDAENTVTFIAWDKNSCPSREASVTITHQTGATVDAGTAVPRLQNVAWHQPIESGCLSSCLLFGVNGEISTVNDGKLDTAVTLSFTEPTDFTGACDTFAWVRVDLGKSYNVTRIALKWAADANGRHATCYDVLLSAAEEAPDPTQSDAWESVENATGASGDTQTIQLSPTPARWAAVRVYENGQTGFDENFRLAEFEVWGYDPDVVPTQQEKCE